MTITDEEPIGDLKHSELVIEPGFPDSATWVTRWLCPNLEREIKRTFEWCPSWWDHPEAVQRIESLWRAWEALRLQGGIGMSQWWVSHADRQLAVLCNPDVGPFGHCHTTHGRDIAPLVATDPPDGWPLRPAPAADPSPAASASPGEGKP